MGCRPRTLKHILFGLICFWGLSLKNDGINSKSSFWTFEEFDNLLFTFCYKAQRLFKNHATLVKEIYSLLTVSIAQQFRCNSFNSADNSFWIKLMIIDTSQNPEAIQDWRMERTSLDPEIRVRTFRRQLSRKNLNVGITRRQNQDIFRKRKERSSCWCRRGIIKKAFIFR